jgi:hypothetical protein
VSVIAARIQGAREASVFSAVIYEEGLPESLVGRIQKEVAL